MPTKTDVLAELTKLEAKCAAAHEDYREVSGIHAAKQAQFRELEGERSKRFRQRPGEFKPDGTPLPETEGERLSREIDKLGQYDFTVEIAHAKHVEEVANAERDEFLRRNHEVVVKALEPEGREVADRHAQKVAELQAVNDEVIRFAQKVQGLVAPVRGVYYRNPALDQVADIKRYLKRLEPIPNPAEVK